MKKLDTQTPNVAVENIERLIELFPTVATEVENDHGELERVVDYDALRELLGDVAEGSRERYQFTWPGKREAKAEAHRPIEKTMRPCPEESVNWDTTENLYIEGDNLDALKILRETYAGKVKLIYIDPPYNTGNDFVYDDNFAQTHAEYNSENGEYDEEGGRLVANLESNGRFHSDWCSMIYSRILLARDLLTDDGVMFISIDDNEQENLKKICDEVFGAQNFIAQVIWERAYAPINLKKHFSNSHDYVLSYAKNIEQAVNNGVPRSGEANDRYSNPDNDPRGSWKSSDMSVGPAVESNIYPITTPSGRVVEPPAGRSWRLSEKAFSERLQDNRIWFGKDGTGVPCIKRFLSELKKTGITPITIWKHTEVDHSQGATQKLADLFDGEKFFDYPKPVDLIKRCIQLYSDKDSIVLDFFSGSATTAHATMQLNAEDGGNRKFIMVQLPEPCDEKSPAYRAGYENICKIAQERIRRAGAKITNEIEESSKQLSFSETISSVPDIGFRALKIDSSNFKNTYTSPQEIQQAELFDLIDNVKDNRSGEDLLFQVLPKFRIPYSASIEKLVINDKTVYKIEDGLLVACFDTSVDTDTIEQIARMQPSYAVMRDLSFKSDEVEQNFEELFKTFSPDTIRRVI